MIPYRMEYIELLCRVFLNCYQVVSAVSNAKDFSSMRSSGAGFVVERSGRKYFVTCEHVIEPYNDGDFCGWEKSPMVGVFVGKNDEESHLSLCIPLGGWYRHTKIPTATPADNLVWPVSFDLAFCDAADIDRKCSSIGFADVVSRIGFVAGLQKGFFAESEVLTDQGKYGDGRYFVIGTIVPVNHDGWTIKRRDKLHMRLRYVRMEEGLIVLRSDKKIDKDADWGGLSGSPVVSDDGQLLGMLLRVVDRDYEVFVLPISEVFAKIDEVNRLQASGVNLSQPAIVVPRGTTMEDVRNNPAVDMAIQTMDESLRK